MLACKKCQGTDFSVEGEWLWEDDEQPPELLQVEFECESCGKSAGYMFLEPEEIVRRIGPC